MPTSPDAVIVARYTRRYNRLRLAAATMVGRAWDDLADLDDVAADRFTNVAATLSLSAQTQTAANVDGYLALLYGDSPTGLDAANVTGPAVRAGATPEDVYHRAIVTARTGISEGLGYVEAMRQGRRRALDAAQTDVALTQRATMAQVGTRRGIVGYRRVLTGKSCALCGTASTQRYKTGTLMPLHTSCDCGVAPIIGDKDPGHIINKPLLNDLKAAGRQVPDPDYWRSRHITVDADGTVTLPKIAVHEHGELGPVLTDASHNFTGPGDIAA